jgi:hypothetical protein
VAADGGMQMRTRGRHRRTFVLAGARWLQSMLLVSALAAALGCGDAPSGYAPITVCEPQAVGLVITEVLADPAGKDGGQEWIELTNGGPSPYVLDRMELGIGAPNALRRVTLRGLGALLPGHSIVLGDGSVDTAPIDYSYGGLTLPNTAGEIELACGGVTAAALLYGVPGARRCVEPGACAPAPAAGRSLTRAGQGPTSRWHQAEGATYDGVNVGSPGAANVAAAACQRATGAWCGTRRPVAGALRIEAVLADPIGADPGGEWVRLWLQAAGPMDLNGLIIEARVANRLPRRWTLRQQTCAEVPRRGSVDLGLFGLTGPLPPTVPPPGFFVLWGPTLPNAALELSVGFAADDGAVAWLDKLRLPRAVTGIPWVRDRACLEAGCQSGAPATAWPVPADAASGWAGLPP